MPACPPSSLPRPSPSHRRPRRSRVFSYRLPIARAILGDLTVVAKPGVSSLCMCSAAADWFVDAGSGTALSYRSWLGNGVLLHVSGCTLVSDICRGAIWRSSCLESCDIERQAWLLKPPIRFQSTYPAFPPNDIHFIALHPVRKGIYAYECLCEIRTLNCTWGK